GSARSASGTRLVTASLPPRCRAKVSRQKGVSSSAGRPTGAVSSVAVTDPPPRPASTSPRRCRRLRTGFAWRTLPEAIPECNPLHYACCSRVVPRCVRSAREDRERRDMVRHGEQVEPVHLLELEAVAAQVT